LSISYVFDDNGNAAHKAAYFDENDEIQTLKCPTQASSGDNPMTDLSGVPVDTYRVSGQVICCSTERASNLDTRTANYQLSPINKALVAHVVTKAGLQSRAIALGVTVPWGEAFLQGTGSKNIEHLTAVANHYKQGELINLSNREGFNFDSVDAYPEGLSAFFDFMIDSKGNPTALSLATQGPVGIIDIGGSTTDVVTIIKGSSITIDHGRSGTKNVGVLDAKKTLEKAITDGHMRNGGGVASSRVVDAVFNTGFLGTGPKADDFTKPLASIKKTVSSQIINYIDATIGSVWDYQTLLIVGGGAIVFKKELSEKYPNAHFSDEFANARGGLKYMRAYNG